MTHSSTDHITTVGSSSADPVAYAAQIIGQLTPAQLVLLTERMGTEWGLDPSALSVGSGAPAAAAEAAAEPTSFNVVLVSVGDNKINVIKALREVTGLGLMEAKTAVEKAGTIKEKASKTEAEKALAALTASGATCKLDPVFE